MFKSAEFASWISFMAKQLRDIRLLYYGAWVSLWRENLKFTLVKPVSGEVWQSYIRGGCMIKNTPKLFLTQWKICCGQRRVVCRPLSLGLVSCFLINAAIVNFNISFRQPLPLCHWVSNNLLPTVARQHFWQVKCQNPVTPNLSQGVEDKSKI